jgi:iron complex outermembrane receptor protein
MNLIVLRRVLSCRLAPLVGVVAAFVALMMSPLVPRIHAAEASVISGTVSNAATRNLLAGARVELPQLGRSVLTDETGRFVLNGLPAGTHEIMVSYIGLDSTSAQVLVTEGGRAERNFDLTAAIYKLDVFKVTGEREGDASALTLQRNSENLKNIVAMDSFGNLPNMSVGEVVMRLPGMAGSPTDEGLNYGFNTRGTGAGQNTVTVDGQLMPSLGTSRAFELQSITGTMFEALELTKGHRPDQNADSLGGTLNLKTRSPFSMREKRRTNYSFTTRWAPPFTDQIPIREQHRAHPLVNLSHTELFDVFGGTRNLAVSANAFYSENVIGFTWTTFDYQNTLNPNAYMFNFLQRDNFNNRKQWSLNVRTDYRWSPTTRFYFTLLGNTNIERFRRRMAVTATSGSNSAAPNINTALSNDHYSVVNPGTGNNLDISIDGPRNYFVRTRRFDFGGEHEYPRLQIDYTGGWGYTHLNNGDGTAGSLTMRLGTVSPAGVWSAGGAGWIIDRTHSDFLPSFRQNGGPDFTNPANYRPTGNLGNSNTQNDQHLTQFRFNVRYQLPLPMPTYLKTGFSYRSQVIDVWAKDQHRWTYAGTGPLPTQYIPNYYSQETGIVFPRWYSNDFMDKRRPKDPSLWTEDRYYHESQKYSGTRGLKEVAQAAYLMAQGRLGSQGFLGRTGYLGGVRVEDTSIDSWGWIVSRVPSTTAQRNADPVAAARQDYDSNFRKLHGEYRKPYPSIHTWHDLNKNLKVRASYSTSFGRADLSNFLPAESYDVNNQRVNVSNPGLLPQQAKTWDASIEYYFEPVGSLSVGWFHKSIRDYIITNQEIRTIPSGPDNGYNGQYDGWTEFSSLNAGNAIAEGWEFAYRQQFTFLPGLLKGFAASFNYTWIDGHGPLNGANGYLNKKELAGFIPYVANASLSWRHRNFSARILYNFTGEYLTSFNVNPAVRQYRESFKTVNVGVAYQLRPSLGFTIDVANIFNEPQVLYRGFKGRTSQTTYNFVTISAGVNGRF